MQKHIETETKSYILNRPLFMKTTKLFAKLCMSVLCVLASFASFTQVQTARYVSMVPNTNAYYEYLPQGYSATGTTGYPVMIFVHGIGELGNGSPSILPTVLRNGPPHLISIGTFPNSFTVNNKSFKFIVISPQFIVKATPNDIEGIINYVIKNYNVDTSRIYLTGLSLGGGTAWNYASANAYCANRLAAIVPVCGASTPTQPKADIIAQAGLPVWALQNLYDPTVPSKNTVNWVADINASVPPPITPAIATIFNASGHDAWTQAYDPLYTENGLNVYQWMLQYTKERVNAPPVTNKPLIISLGNDTTILLPTNSVPLKATVQDPNTNATVTSYSWVKTAGPAQYTISSSTVPNPTVSNLVNGKYVFKLTAKDNLSNTASDSVNITVATPPFVISAGNDISLSLPANSVTLSGLLVSGNAAGFKWTELSGPNQFTVNNDTILTPLLSNLIAGSYKVVLTGTDITGLIAKDTLTITVIPLTNTAFDTIAGIIQAEHYASMYKVTVEKTLDSLSGSDVGRIGIGSWMNYNVFVKKATIYNVNFRVASPTSGGLLYLEKSDGTLLSVVNVPNTGGWQNWRTVTISVKLDTGTQVLRIYDQKGGWNFNWMEFVDPSASTIQTSKLINVNIYGGINPFADSAWNNWNLTYASGVNLVSDNFNYSDQSPSSVHATLSTSKTILENITAILPTDTLMAPKEVLQYTSLGVYDRKLSIAGLNKADTYNLDIYSSISKYNMSTLFTLDGVTQTIISDRNLNNKAIFQNIVPDSTGTITVSLKAGIAYNFINGFTLTEISGASALTARSVAAGKPILLIDQSVKNQLSDKSLVSIFPNPARENFYLHINNEKKGQMLLQVFDNAGVLRKIINTQKDQTLSLINVNTEKLEPGTYYLRVQIGNWFTTRKIIKL